MWSTIFILVNSILFALLAIAPKDAVVPKWLVSIMTPWLAIVMNLIWVIVVFRFVAYLKYYYDLASYVQKQIPELRFPNSDLLQFRWYQVVSTKMMLQYLPFLFAATWTIILVVL